MYAFYKFEDVNIDQTTAVYYNSELLKVEKLKVEDSDVLSFNIILRILLGFNY